MRSLIIVAAGVLFSAGCRQVALSSYELDTVGPTPYECASVPLAEVPRDVFRGRIDGIRSAEMCRSVDYEQYCLETIPRKRSYLCYYESYCQTQDRRDPAALSISLPDASGHCSQKRADYTQLEFNTRLHSPSLLAVLTDARGMIDGRVPIEFGSRELKDQWDVARQDILSGCPDRLYRIFRLTGGRAGDWVLSIGSECDNLRRYDIGISSRRDRLHLVKVRRADEIENLESEV